MSFTCSRGWTCHIPMARTRHDTCSLQDYIDHQSSSMIINDHQWSLVIMSDHRSPISQVSSLSTTPGGSVAKALGDACGKGRDHFWSRCPQGSWEPKTTRNIFQFELREANMCKLRIGHCFILIHMSSWGLIRGFISSWKQVRITRRACESLAKWEFCPWISEQKNLMIFL